MMGYTHVAWGAAGGLTVAVLSGKFSPDIYLVAVTTGALGGAMPDIDVRDNFSTPKMTDGFRSRVAAIGFLLIGIFLDFIFKLGVLQKIFLNSELAIGGASALAVLVILGHTKEHRKLTHSILFLTLTSICIACIYFPAFPYYVSGFVLHIFQDLLGHQYNGHGLLLLYPWDKNKSGIALGWCTAKGMANKVFYYFGIALFCCLSVYFTFRMRKASFSIIIIFMMAYLLLVLQRVKHTSEFQYHIK